MAGPKVAQLASDIAQMVDVLTKEQMASVILIPIWTPNIIHAASSFLFEGFC